MKSLPLENESFIQLQTAFGDWLSALGYAAISVHYQPLHVRELLFFSEQAGLTRLESLDQDHLKAFFAYLSERTNHNHGGRLSMAYLAKYWQAIKNLDRFLKATQQWGFDLPKQNIRLPPQKQVVLTQGEVKSLYAACGQDYLGLRDRAMLALFYGCGLRRSEGIGLDVNDIKWDQNLILVRKAKNYKERYVPTTEAIQADLLTYLLESRSLIEQESPYAVAKSSPAFLLSRRGLRINDRTLTMRLRSLQERSGEVKLLSKALHLHSLRHSVATHLLQNGMKLAQIALFLGHASLESTQIYTHLHLEP